VVAEFARLIEAGNYFSTVAGYLGFDEGLAYDWLKAGKAGEDATGDWPDAYRAFYQAVTRAEHQAEIAAVAALKQAGQPQHIGFSPKGMPFAVIKFKDAQGKEQERLPGDLKATLEFLARRYRDRWSPTANVRSGQDPNAKPLQAEATITIKDVLANDRARRAACDLVAAVADGEADAGGVREEDEPGPVAPGQAP